MPQGARDQILSAHVAASAFLNPEENVALIMLSMTFTSQDSGSVTNEDLELCGGDSRRNRHCRCHHYNSDIFV
jgi:hypothetical protein